MQHTDSLITFAAELLSVAVCQTLGKRPLQHHPSSYHQDRTRCLQLGSGTHPSRRCLEVRALWLNSVVRSPHLHPTMKHPQKRQHLSNCSHSACPCLNQNDGVERKDPTLVSHCHPLLIQCNSVSAVSWSTAISNVPTSSSHYDSSSCLGHICHHFDQQCHFGHRTFESCLACCLWNCFNLGETEIVRDAAIRRSTSLSVYSREENFHNHQSLDSASLVSAVRHPVIRMN